ncbi:hypothetical protein HPB47_002549 [Ixodes persulcatus]|uniref:Uncharacterized protein n=1 Tax=Ixodes persulcatus TaxID=34615 RepID=A0AC60PM70_IXOPE|nr:hypothetical protein HPB47_002549 [Ixodes persulcatus]
MADGGRRRARAASCPRGAGPAAAGTPRSAGVRYDTPRIPGTGAPPPSRLPRICRRGTDRCPTTRPAAPSTSYWDSGGAAEQRRDALLLVDRLSMAKRP